jgi:3-isopropylmalate dehydratase small subunit
MQPFITHTGLVAPLDRANVDTDPAYFAIIGRHRLILSPEEEFAISSGTTRR